MKLALALVVACVGCRIPSNKWGGTPPRAHNDSIKIALRAEGPALDLARTMLRADPRVSLVDLDPRVDSSLSTACPWAAQNGADYYAIASLATGHSEEGKCLAYGGSILDFKHEAPCIKWQVTSQGSTSSFVLHLYDATTCTAIPIAGDIQQYASGPADQASPEAQSRVEEVAPRRFIGFPDQSTIGTDGRVLNAAGDGQYALFRNREFQGVLALHHAGEANEHLHMLMCCEEPQPGDQLVRRGPMHYYELALSFDAGVLERAASHLGAFGAGLGFRRYPLAGGLQLGGSADLLGTGDHLSAGLLSLDVGWGMHIAAAWHVSAAADVGFAHVVQDVGDAHPSSWTPFVLPHLRAMFAIRWWYVGADVGYALSGTIGAGDWNDTNGMSVPDARVRGPVARLFAGLSL